MTYAEQVETIFTVISTTDCILGELPAFLVPYILDQSYSRAAICEAEKRLKNLLGTCASSSTNGAAH